MKLPNIEINGTLYEGVNDAKLAEIAKNLFEAKQDEVIVGIQLKPNAKTLGYAKYTFAQERPSLKEETIRETLTELAYTYTLHAQLRKIVLEGLEVEKLKSSFKKLVKEMIGQMRVHKDSVVVACNEHAIVIQGMIPEKAHEQAAESLPPIFTLVDIKTRTFLGKLKTLGVLDGCKIFYMTSKDIK